MCLETINGLPKTKKKRLESKEINDDLHSLKRKRNTSQIFKEELGSKYQNSFLFTTHVYVFG